MNTPLLQVDHLTRTYTLPRETLWQAPRRVHAVQEVSLRVFDGKNMGVVGESGSGKSTLARLVMALEPPTSGSITLLGQDLHALSTAVLRKARQKFQMVFQDPYGSLDPRQTIARIVTEPLDVLDKKSAGDRRLMAQDVLNSVGLRSADLDKYPHEFSGGQRQRIAIARALITRPKLIVADEPVSALDVSIQAQVLNLMQDLSHEFGVTYLLISHDLAVIDYLCEEVAVMFQGRLVEQASPQTLFQHAAHPYTRALVDAIPPMIPNPTPGQRKRTVRIAPTQQYGNAACPYASRCPQAHAICGELRPELRTVGEGHRVACHFE